MALTDQQEKEVRDAMEKLKNELSEAKRAGAGVKKTGRISSRLDKLEEKIDGLGKLLTPSTGGDKKKGWWENF